MLIITMWVGRLLYGQTDNYFQYNIKDGLPQSQVYCIAEDRYGYVWFGTQGGGLAKYDGKTFQVISGQQGLGSTYINSICFDDNNIAYIGTNKGIFIWQNGKIQPLQDQTLSSERINIIHQYQNDIYIGTQSGLYSYSGGRVAKIPISNQMEEIWVNDIKTINNQLWVATERGLFIKDRNAFVKLNNLPKPNIHRIYDYPVEDAVWVGVFDYGIVKMTKSTQKVIRNYPNKLFTKTKSILKADNDVLWIATDDNGIITLNTNTHEVDQKNNIQGLPTNKIKCLHRDRWNNIWIGTSGAGVIKSTKQHFQHHNMYDYGFNSNAVYSVTGDSEGKIFFSTLDKIGIYDGKIIRSQENLTPKISSKIKSIAADKSGKLWLATENEGIFSLKNGMVTSYNQANKSLLDDRIMQILCDKDDNIWIATLSTGIQCINQEKNTVKHHRVNKFHGMYDQYVNTIAEDKNQNKVLFGTRNGIVGSIDQNYQLTQWTSDQGLPSLPIKTMWVDEYSNCFVAMPDFGILVANTLQSTVKFKLLDVGNTIYSKNVYSLVTTSDTSLVIGTENGIISYKYDPHTHKCHDMKKYGYNDGFLGIENCQHAVYDDDKGKIWFGTVNGLTSYQTAKSPLNIIAPITYMDDIMVYNVSIKAQNMEKYFIMDTVDTPQTLPPSKNYISFSFDGTQINYADKLKFRYSLSQQEAKWSDWTNGKNVHFSDLSPGNYTFAIQSSINGEVMGNIVTTHFVIGKAFYHYTWFRVMMLFLLLIAFLLIVKWRERSQKIKNENIRKELILKNELLSLEQKALQLQMNPHFIFNALNSIQSLVMHKAPDDARTQIQNFAVLMRSVLHNSKQKNISLAQEIDTLDQYLRMEQFCQKNSFEFEILLNDDIDSQDVLLPTMLIQPFVENAVIHGISHLESSGLVTIVFELNDNLLQCTITDNGVGRAQSQKLSLNAQKSHTSYGMEVTLQRLIALNHGDLTSQQIIDLNDEKGSPAGTQVVLKIPIEFTY